MPATHCNRRILVNDVSLGGNVGNRTVSRQSPICCGGRRVAGAAHDDPVDHPPRRLQKPNSARSAMARSIGSTDSTMQHNHNADALANVMPQGAARRLARLAGWVALLGTPFVAGDDACASAQIARDPHIKFAHGGRADFRGKDGQLYCFLSAPGLAVNVKTEDAAFTLHHGRLRVDGSFITEVHLAAIVGGSKRKQVRRADCR